jgi:O-methyltransferase involved in polyketide biosynthesis
MNLSNISRTAIITLVVHVIMSEKKIINDPMAVLCLENMMSLATEEEKQQIIKTKNLLKGIGRFDAKSMTKRLKIMDAIVNDHITHNLNCTVINLACGFDTRYWRIDNKKCNYIEIDLSEVVAIKQELLKENINYEIIGCSVLDYSWIDKATTSGNENFLIIAEGLLNYLPEQDVRNFLQTISQRFINSQIVFDMFPKYLTKGLWKIITTWHSRLLLGMDISFESGYNKPKEIESYGFGYKIIDIKKLGYGSMIINSSINK